MGKAELHDLNSARPFRRAAKAYVKAGWCPIPLPPKKKFPPPTGATGRAAPRVGYEEVEDWLASDAVAKDANIGLRLYDVLDESGDPFLIEDHSGKMVPATVVGIDVDDYEDKDGNQKSGYATLESLEKKLGELPETWISSAREDGRSGIRYFLAPATYSYRGSAGESIEVIQAAHRFAVVWPSWHPTAGQYQWYRPGVAPIGSAYSASAGGSPAGAAGKASGGKSSGGSASKGSPEMGMGIPVARELPALPMEWIDHLTQNFQPHSEVAIDMEIGVDELYDWAKEHFAQAGGPKTLEKARRYVGAGAEASGSAAMADTEACSLTKKRVEAWNAQIEDSPDSHNPMKDGQWNLLCMGLEGHRGWLAACLVIEAEFLEHTVSAGKRGMSEAKMEMFRGRTNALRRIKAKVDQHRKDGVNLLGRTCGCYDGDSSLLNELGLGGLVSEDESGDGSSGSGLGGSGEFEIDLSKAKDPFEYERNDDGNAEHFLDIFGGDFRYVEETDKWIYWNSLENRWCVDSLGVSRRAFRVVKKRQALFVRQLENQLVVAQSADNEQEVKKIKAKLQLFRQWAAQSGNNVRAENALKAASKFHGVSLHFDSVDSKPHLLGVANGVLDLSGELAVLRNATRDDMILKNTGVPFADYGSLAGSPNEEYREAHRVWEDYLDTFLPICEENGGDELRLWVQQVMGYCMFGLNTKRRLIFLYGTSSTGKSTLLNAIMAALGEYASAVDMDIFKEGLVNPQMVDVISDRVITLSEADSSARDVSREMFKKASGGDPVPARGLFSNHVIKKVPSFTPVIATNSPPQINADKAFDVRLEVIPFNHAVPSSEKGSKVERLAKVAVLSWLAEGWAIFRQHDLENRPKIAAFLESRDDFKDKMSPMSEFISEYLERVDDSEWEASKDIYRAYKSFAQENGIDRPFSNIKLGRELAAAGFDKSESKKISGEVVKIRRGLKLKKSHSMARGFRIKEAE